MITLGWFTRRWQSLVIGTVAVVGMFSTVAGEGVLAQIEPDDTLGAESSTVRSLDPNLPVDVIEQGAIRESNLFHSFLEFNVDAGRGVYFFSPANIENILTRVTGNNPSRIFGVLGTFGDSSPNLFLMNPNGILFGPNASLDIEGSFFATTADAIRLGDAGLFSATEPAKSNLLTVNPSAFLFNAIAAQPILNQSQAASVIDQPNSNGGSPGLQVRAGQTLGLVGGDVRLEGGNLTAAGGRIELGSVAGIGEVSLTQMGNRFVLGYDSIAEFGDISLSEGAFVDASGEGGGDVQIRSARLEMTQSSDIWADTLGEIPGGEVRVKTTESVTLSEGSLLFADVFGAGDGGDVTILTQDLRILDGAALSASTFGVGNAGNLRVEATDQIEVIGSPEGNASFIAARVNSGATGNAGNLTLNTGELFLSQGSQISVSTFGEGNGGELNVNASQIELNGDNPINGNPSGLFAAVEDGATGNGGNVTISTQDLRIKDGAELSASTLGEGNSGNLTVTAKDKIEVIGSPEGNSSNIAARVNRGATGNGGNLTLETGELFVSQGGQISVGTFGEGNGGELNVNASQIELNGDNPINGNPSGLFAAVEDGATGNGGNVTISTQDLRIKDGAELSASTLGEGNSGNLTVTAKDKIEVIGSPEGNASFIAAQVDLGATGNAGNLTLETGELLVSQGSQISVSTFGEGDGGELNVNASQIELNGTNPIDGTPSGLFAAVGSDATGDGGNVTISTQNLRIKDGAFLDASTLGEGNSGNLTVTATDKIEVIGSPEGNASFIRAQVNRGATGNAGNLTLNTGELLVSQGGQIRVSTFGEGDGGELNVNASQIELNGDNPIDGTPSGLFARVGRDATGIGGNVTISTEGLRIVDGADLSASTFGEGNSGNLTVTAKDKIEVIGSPEGNSSGIAAQVNPGATGNAGNLTLETGELLVSQGGQISVGTLGEGNGGELKVNATEIELNGRNPINGNASGLFASVQPDATGDGGNVTISTQDLRIKDGAELSASTFGEGNSGNLTVTATDKIEVIGSPEGNASGIAAQVDLGATGNAGNLTLETGELLVSQGSQISVGTFGEGNGGELKINASQIELNGRNPIDNRFPSGLFANVNPNATGIGGNVTISTQGLRIKDGASLSASTFGEGNSGNLTVTATDKIEVIGTDAEGNASGIAAQVEPGATGNAGNLTLNTGELLVSQGSQISVSTFGEGDGGQLNVNASQIELNGDNPINGNPSGLFARVEPDATGTGGEVRISIQGLRILDGAQLSTRTAGMGDAGDVTVTATDKIEVIGTDTEGNPSSINALVRARATGNGGNLTLNTPSLLVTDNGLLSVATFGNGTAGNLLINTQTLTVTNDATVSAATSSPSPDGIGGNLTINATDRVQLTNQGRIIAQSTGAAKAGDIQINTEHLSATNGTIATSTEQSAGGAITITASDIRLFEDSDITSRVALGAGGGGNITLTANTILAFDDSDILAYARDGRGGDISLNTVAFFGENFKPAPRGTDPVTLDINDRVDINADGAVVGTITIPDTSFIENSFILLSGDGIDTDELIAESCIARRHQPQRGSFFITGTGGIPFRPGDLYDTPYQTGTVRSIPASGEEEPSRDVPVERLEAGEESSSSTRRPWKMGDPIIEPTGIYRLPNGKVIMSRECGE